MFSLDPVILKLLVALGIGLLIGGERERRKGDGPSRSPAGIRTFTFASLAGAVSFIVGGEMLLTVTTAGVTPIDTSKRTSCRRVKTYQPRARHFFVNPSFLPKQEPRLGDCV